MPVLRKKYRKYMCRCVQEKFNLWLETVSDGLRDSAEMAALEWVEMETHEELSPI